jgi:pSer/pThr/pTyr-binding forkhead associated (FHA) protein
MAPPVATQVAAPGARVCPSCKASVPAGFLFCGQCGSRLGTAPEAAAPVPAPVAAVPQPRGHLILMRPDGNEGSRHPVLDGENLVGRGQGPLFDGDAYLSPRHAVLTPTAHGLEVQDLGSLNGVFLKITQEEELQHGDVFRVGQELIRFEAIRDPEPTEDGTEVMGSPNPGFWGRLVVLCSPEIETAAYPLRSPEALLGRERGDVVFRDDGYVSASHARVMAREGRVFLADLGSSNGTFLRLRQSRVLPTASYLLIGQQLFKVDLR